MGNQLQEALSAAFDEVERNDESTQIEGYEPEGEPSAVSEGNEYEDSPSGFGERPDDGNGADVSAVSGDQQSDDALQAPAEVSSDLATPDGLPPQAREDWASVPDSVKEYVAKFDERMKGMQQRYGQDSARVQAMDKTLAPYQQLFAMNGGPQNVLPGILQTAATLQMGAPQQKAQMVAGLIQQFSVDVSMLDSLLVGEQATPSPETQINQLVDQRLAPLQQQLQTYQQREQQMARDQENKINTELEDFAKANEFYQDVKMDMADILDLASNRGQNMTLAEAYEKACQLRPDIAKILQARQSVAGQNQRRRAASSLHGRAGGEAASEPQGLRGTLEAAWQNSGRV